jgi:hypothetical protein
MFNFGIVEIRVTPSWTYVRLARHGWFTMDNGRPLQSRSTTSKTVR